MKQIVTEPTNDSDENSLLIAVKCFSNSLAAKQCQNVNILSVTDYMSTFSELNILLRCTLPEPIFRKKKREIF